MEVAKTPIKEQLESEIKWILGHGGRIERLNFLMKQYKSISDDDEE